jgi:phage major head subunit gpT-like protein
MHITDQDILDAANDVARAGFESLFETDPASGLFERIAEEQGADSETGSVNFLGAMPVLKKWVGKKKATPTRAYSHSFALEPYEATIEIPRMKVRYDRLGLIQRRIAAFQRRQRYWREKLIIDELLGNPTGYDGVSLFSASHPHGPSGATQSNTTTSALSVSTLKAAIQAGQELRDAEGETMGVDYDLLVCGPKLRQTAMDLTGSTRVQAVSNAGALDATSNVVAATQGPNTLTGGMMDVHIDPRFVGTYDDYWMLFDTTLGVPSMLLYVGRDLEWIPKTDMDSEGRFVNDLMAWSVEADADPIAGAWQSCYAGIL